jgi:hypothetical protein
MSHSSFTFEGLFDSCITKKVDVSNPTNEAAPDAVYDWITLGGFKKDGNPTLGKNKAIKISRNNAMKLFWNFRGISGADLEGFVGGVNQDSLMTINLAESSQNFPRQFDELKLGNVNYSISQISEMTPAEFEALKTEPKNRVCGGVGAVKLGEELFFNVAPASVRCGVATDAIVLMYDGDVEEEDNFIGYGLDYNFGGFRVTGYGIFPQMDIGSIARYLDESEVFDSDKKYFTSATNPNVYSGRAIKYVELGAVDSLLYPVKGIPFLADFAVEDYTSSIDITQNDSKTKVTADYNNGLIQLELYDLKFYTYL